MGSQEDDDRIYKDARFAHLVNDPRFKRLPQSQRKVKVDKRFQGMFNDDNFKVKYKVDKYGRKVNKTSGDDLKKFYEISSGEDDDNDVDEEAEKRKGEIQISKDDDERTASEAEDNEDEESEVDEDGNAKLKTSAKLKSIVKKKLQDMTIDYARGEGKILTDSSSDDDSSEGEDEEDKELFIEHVWGELDRDAPMTEDSTRRLAVCNMDWDRMRATDIMVLCNSFLPPGGIILTVTVYPSEYGKERLAEEEVKGPMELIENTKANVERNAKDDDDEELLREEGDEGDDYHMEKLRQYQLNRLKYYYAVIECDSVSTADKLYAECDGLEYESTATKMDLRFIPDDMDFEDEPRDKCSELPDMSKYKPRIFTTTALQQVKVDLTWDETELERKELTEKLATGKINDVSDADLRKYVAYSSEEEEDNEDDNAEPQMSIASLAKKAANSDSESEDESADESEVIEKPTKNGKKGKPDSISKYKDLLAEINKQEEDVKKNKIEMEYTWGIGMTGKSDKPDKNKSKKPLTSDVNPFEKLLEKKNIKKKEKRKALRKARKAKAAGSGDEEDDESEDDMPDGLDMNDPYFAEEFENGEFEKPKSKSSSKGKKSKKTDDSDDEEERRAAELELLLDDGEEEKAHFSLKKIQDAENETKSKKKRRKHLKKSKKEIEANKKEQQQLQDDFEVNVTDSRFNAVFESHLFNIDPSDSHFKKTKGMEMLIKEKLKRKHGNSTDGGSKMEEAKKPKSDLATRMLVNSIKRKIAGSNLN